MSSRLCYAEGVKMKSIFIPRLRRSANRIKLPNSYASDFSNHRIRNLGSPPDLDCVGNMHKMTQ
jgi:hypothetical protein